MAIESQSYFALWNKYRPAILQLMKGATQEPQRYQLSDHEFKAVGGVKSGYAFSLETLGDKASNNIGVSAIARDLILMLQQSKTGTLLMKETSYHLRLDSHFVFHVAKKPEAEAISK
ncbi:MAG: hypothetical protein SH857_15760 [Chitinophagales bacterium]|nr:hypothetical protein [Chitinophagales bacterium]